ncbi:DUF2267 domain-containing protein [Humitalea sp. 24SJ18S-53]|uniref:DUF2267 domain-containing protein n=1 Tax=Humitalea sp. 24SJ18S-53 TaxID=3422307 RepID=UPI003D672BCF
MPATGVDVWDKTLQTTNIWLDEIMERMGPDRHTAWHALGAVLRALRDRLPLELAAHLGAQLPLLVRGTYYDQWHVGGQTGLPRTLDDFFAVVELNLGNTRPMSSAEATAAVFRTLSNHVDRGQIRKVVAALPAPLRDFWLDCEAG